MNVECTYHLANGMFLCGCSLFNCVVDNKVEENVKPAQDTTNLASALKVDEQAFVHKLQEYVSTWIRSILSILLCTFLSSGCEAFDMVNVVGGFGNTLTAETINGSSDDLLPTSTPLRLSNT